MEDVRQAVVDSEVAALKNSGAIILKPFFLCNLLDKRSRVGGRETYCLETKDSRACASRLQQHGHACKNLAFKAVAPLDQ